jgi:hypothetical protein
MSVLGEIIQLAKETATRIQERTTYLYQEYLEAENLASEKKAKFDFANLAFNRAAEFQAEIDGQFQCPICWIQDGRRSNFNAVPGDAKNDLLRCQRGHEHSVPSGSMRGR